MRSIGRIVTEKISELKAKLQEISRTLKVPPAPSPGSRIEMGSLLQPESRKIFRLFLALDFLGYNRHLLIIIRSIFPQIQ